MYRKMRHVLVVMAVSASLLLFGVTPAYAHDHDDLDDVLDEVHDIIDDVVYDVLDGLEDLDLH